MNFIFLSPFHFDIVKGAKHPGKQGFDHCIAGYSKASKLSCKQGFDHCIAGYSKASELS